MPWQSARSVPCALKPERLAVYRCASYALAHQGSVAVMYKRNTAQKRRTVFGLLPPSDAVQDLLRPPADALLETYPVDKCVNTPRHDEASLIHAVEP